MRHRRGAVELTHRVVARSEATKQSSFFACGAMDCFASLAMTVSTRRPGYAASTALLTACGSAKNAFEVVLAGFTDNPQHMVLLGGGIA
jgi:hypothetical protein